jgi:hypothetical protein
VKAALLMALALAAACVVPPAGRDYSKLVASNPRAILVVPAVNKSVDVDAADYFLSTLPVPLAERGYYVFPVNLVKRVLEDDGLADAAMVEAADPVRLCALFGADAVLYSTIDSWTAKYVVVTTQVEVQFSYVLKDGKTGEELWRGTEQGIYSTSSGQGLLGDIIVAAVHKASPNYMPLARAANAKALAYPGPGLPAGPYRADYRKDLPANRPKASPNAQPKAPSQAQPKAAPQAQPKAPPQAQPKAPPQAQIVAQPANPAAAPPR